MGQYAKHRTYLYRRLLYAVAVVVLAMGLMPHTAVASFAAPVPVSPGQGASVAAGSSVTFTVQAPPNQSLYVSVSSSPATNSNGTIGSDQDFAAMSAGADPTVYSHTAGGYSYFGYYLATPGTYYWQASYFACDSSTFQCGDQNTPVMTLNVVAPAPVATTQPPSSITATTATLNGTIDTKGSAGTFYFDLGRDTSYGTRSGIGQASAADQGTPVYVNFTGLASATVYHYRLVLTTPGGTSYGNDQVLYTAPLDHRDRIPSWIGRQGGGMAFLLDTADFLPDGVSLSRFRNIVDRSASRWGLRDVGNTWNSPATTRDQIDGISEVGFTSDLPDSTLGERIIWYGRVRVGRRRVCQGGQCHRTLGHIVIRIYDYDVAFNANLPWDPGPWYPDDAHYDLESTVLHELGHFAGNPHHQHRCTDSPMVEALGTGEFWRAPNEWFEFGCGQARDRTSSSASRFRGRTVTVLRQVPAGWRPKSAAVTRGMVDVSRDSALRSMLSRLQP
jgi:hypothetical protein